MGINEFGKETQKQQNKRREKMLLDEFEVLGAKIYRLGMELTELFKKQNEIVEEIESLR